MRLSVLKIGDDDNYCLYDLETKTAILKGREDELYDWKNKLETAQQQTDNRRYMNDLRKERISMLVGAGHSQEEAIQFLKNRMPYLWQK